jgi:hypothetical protein
MLFLLLSPLASNGARAQGNPNQFGGQDRANAISLMTVLAVQQGISSLPPASGQSPEFVYDFDLNEGTFVPSLVPGPTVFRAAETIGAHTLILRAGLSYFELAHTFDPINYLVQFDKPYQGTSKAVVGFGAHADVNVSVVNLSASYGLTQRTELTFNLPLTVVHAEASQISSTLQSLAGLPPSKAIVAGATSVAAFQTLIRPSCRLGPDICLVYRRDSFNALGFNFNQGTHAGVGRISLGGKALLYSSRWVHMAFMTELFMPSPSENEFSGPDSAAILPRAIFEVPAANWLRTYADIGYDYDFNESALRRLTWTAGASVPFTRFAFDLGVAGSEYDTPISWTPAVAHGAPYGEIPGSTLTVLGDNQLGDNFIDFVGGLKLQLANSWFLSGAVDVPLNNQGFRPAALGTLAIEYHVHSG